MSHISPEYLKALHEDRLAEAERYRTARQLRDKRVIRHPLRAALHRLRGQWAPTPTDAAEQPTTEPLQGDGPMVADTPPQRGDAREGNADGRQPEQDGAQHDRPALVDLLSSHRMVDDREHTDDAEERLDDNGDCLGRPTGTCSCPARSPRTHVIARYVSTGPLRTSPTKRRP